MKFIVNKYLKKSTIEESMFLNQSMLTTSTSTKLLNQFRKKERLGYKQMKKTYYYYK